MWGASGRSAQMTLVDILCGVFKNMMDSDIAQIVCGHVMSRDVLAALHAVRIGVLAAYVATDVRGVDNQKEQESRLVAVRLLIGVEEHLIRGDP